LNLINRDELNLPSFAPTKEVIKNSKARYLVGTPDWKYIKKDISYDEAIKILREKSQEYQRQLLAEFESKNK
jgi:hypothetical protein